MKGEPITVTIEAPITEHCSKCSYEAFYSFDSFHCNCPECGESSIRHGARITEHPVVIYPNYGNYDLCSTEKEYSYSFHNVPEVGQCQFITKEEIDISDPLEAIYELVAIFSRYLYTSQLEKAKQLEEILSRDDVIEKQDELLTQERKRKAETELYKILAA